MKKLKVVTVVGTRPEIIRLSRVMAALDEHCDHILVHTGQNYDYELNQIFFDDLEIRKPDHFLNAAGASGAETIGNVIIAVDRVLAEIEPDALLVWAIPIAVWLLFLPNVARFLRSIWKLVIVVLICASLRRSIVVLSTTRRTST